MIITKNNKAMIIASVLSWAMLFSLPFINGHFNNGEVWVKLCTHTGVQFIAIESAEVDQPGTELDCPCFDKGIKNQLAAAAYSAIQSEYTEHRKPTHQTENTIHTRPQNRAPPFV